MNNIEDLLKILDTAEETTQRKREALKELRIKLGGLSHDVSLSFGGYPEGIDIDFPGRDVCVDLITHIKAGKWEKEPSGWEGKINYINRTLLPVPLRLYGAEPPASCKVVVVEELVPATPAHTVKRLKVVCEKEELTTV